ncbi:hypothetical protein BR93DRAFT_149768 [Coniochaeta sp. PMI_546]|nr:hypothetical protein BR93DRAFT_149768 [Coniochaeta sp. PMI_546]
MADHKKIPEHVYSNIESLYVTANVGDIAALDNFLEIIPDRESSVYVLPTEEMEERLDLVQKLESYWKDNYSFLTNKDASYYTPFSNHQVAALMGMDLASLRFATRTEAFSEALLQPLSAIGSLTKLFLTKAQSADDIRMAELASPSLSPGLPKKRRRSDESFESNETMFGSNGDAKRNIQQAKKRLALDNNGCIILQNADPEVCHIIPFSANAKTASRQKFASWIGKADMLLFPDGDNSTRYMSQARKLFTSRNGSSDKKWNMISLDDKLYKWWGKAYFGFKCLGTVLAAGKPQGITTIKLQFHWMPRKVKPLEPLGKTKDEFLGAFRGTYGDQSSEIPVVAMLRPRSGRPLQTGDIFYVDIQTEHADKMIVAFELQWALIKIAAIAGGAEALDLVGDEPDFLDEDGRFYSVAARFRATYEECILDWQADVQGEPAIDIKGKGVDEETGRPTTSG